VLLAAPGSKCAFTSVVKVAARFAICPAFALVARMNASHLCAAKLQHEHFLHGACTHTGGEESTHKRKVCQSRGRPIRIRGGVIIDTSCKTHISCKGQINA